MKALMTAALLLCSITGTAQAPHEQSPADIKLGNGFVSVCSAIEKMEAGHLTDLDLANLGICTGYLMGVGDGLDLAEATLKTQKTPDSLRNVRYCIPESVTLGQEVRVVLKYIRTNPEKAHFPTVMLASSALRKAFPCSSR